MELELGFLQEIGRLNTKAEKIIQKLGAEIGLERSEEPFSQVISFANRQTWTRDLFDRIIVGEAMAADGC